jgi:hypothetical protein
MVCYQVTAQFTFYQHVSALVSTRIKKTKGKGFFGFVPIALRLRSQSLPLFSYQKRSGTVCRVSL